MYLLSERRIPSRESIDIDGNAGDWQNETQELVVESLIQILI